MNAGVLEMKPASGAKGNLESSLRLWWSQWWPHHRAGLTLAWLVTLVGMAVLPWIPQRYESRARVYVETSGTPHEAVGMWNAAGETDRQIRILAKSVTAGPQLDRLVDLFGPNLSTAQPPQREAIVAGLLSRIRMVADEPGLYTISYRDTDELRSRQVVDGVVELFVSTGQRQRQREAQRALQVLAEQTRLSEERFTWARQRLDNFVKEHGLQPQTDGQDVAGRRAALQESVTRLRSEVRAAEQVRQTYRDELNQDISAKASKMASTGAVSDLPNGLYRLGEKHPEVIAARQASEGPTSGTGSATGTSGSDSLQQRLRASLADANAQVALLRAKLSAEESQLTQWRKPFDKAPALEPEWQQLRLDLETAQKHHEALLGKVESASIALKADSDPQTTAVRVVEPSRANPAALFPARMHLAIGLSGLALVVALSASIWMQTLRPKVRNTPDLQQALGHPVVTQVPWQGSSAGLRIAVPWSSALVAMALVITHTAHVIGWWGGAWA